MLTSWNTQCGIAEYSRMLKEAFDARSDVELVILGSRNYDEREAEPYDFEPETGDPYQVFDVELWNRYGYRALDVEHILSLGFDVLHVQYENVLYNRERLHELIDRFDGPVLATWHDNCFAPGFRWYDFDHAFTHRQGVGPGDPEIIPFPVRDMPKIVRTFGLGRTREDILRPMCERNGWTFETAATHEGALGGQSWKPWRELHDWLRGGDVIVLFYDDNGMAGSSQAARTALATSRPVVVNNVSWFGELPTQAGSFYKVPDEAAMERTLRLILAPGPLVAQASADRVVDLHVQRYAEALAQIQPVAA